jgi:hypothetical protein
MMVHAFFKHWHLLHLFPGLLMRIQIGKNIQFRQIDIWEYFKQQMAFSLFPLHFYPSHRRGRGFVHQFIKVIKSVSCADISAGISICYIPGCRTGAIDADELTITISVTDFGVSDGLRVRRSTVI